ncbi:hypothetical protein ACFSHQ_17945 [Gemmobacter lanyuensis]
MTHFNVATRAMETTDLGLISVPEVAEGDSVSIRSLLSDPGVIPSAPDALAQVTAKAIEVDADRAAAQAAREVVLAARDQTIAAASRTYDTVSALLADETAWPVGTKLTVRGTGDYQAVINDGDATTAGGVEVYAQPLPAEYVDRQFFVAADGIADDTAAYQRIASKLPPGKTLRIAGGGTRIIGAQIAFAQPGIKIVADVGSKIMQRSGTGSIDTLVTLSGLGAEVHGLQIDANNAGNPTAGYTGRGELLKMSGDRQVVRNVSIVGGHVKDFAAGIYITGKHVIVDGVTGDGTGRILLRGRADFATIRNVVGRNIQPSVGVSNKVLVWDGGDESNNPFTWLLFENIYGHSTSSTHQSLIVVDSSTVIGGKITARNLFADYPNQGGPDSIKFVNFQRLDIDGLTTRNGGDAGSNCCLRLQQDDALNFTGHRAVSLRGLDLAGHVNFDGTQPARVFVGGDCRIGATLEGPACIDDLPNGYLTIADGAVLGNFTGAVIATRSDAFDPIINIGRVEIVGAVSTGTPYANRRIVQHRAYITGSPTRRIRAGQVAIDEPLRIENTRTFAADQRWVMDNETLDASVAQGRSAEYLVSGTDFALTSGPRDTDGWVRGTRIYRRDPSAGQVDALRCVTAGSSCQTAWAPTTAYSIGARRYNGANVYVCVTAGTSASSGGPTGTGAAISDGTAVWDFVAVRAVFAVEGQIGIPTDTASQIAAAAAGINTSAKFAGKLVKDATNNRLMIARGASATDSWDVVDGSATVTPM